MIADDHEIIAINKAVMDRGQEFIRCYFPRSISHLAIGTTDRQLRKINKRLSTLMVIVQAGMIKWMNPAAINYLGGHWIGKMAINVSSFRCRESVYAGRLKVLNGESSEWQSAEWISKTGAAIYGRRRAEPCQFNKEPAGLVTFEIRRFPLQVVRPALQQLQCAGGGGD